MEYRINNNLNQKILQQKLQIAETIEEATITGQQWKHNQTKKDPNKNKLNYFS